MGCRGSLWLALLSTYRAFSGLFYQSAPSGEWWATISWPILIAGRLGSSPFDHPGAEIIARLPEIVLK